MTIDASLVTPGTAIAFKKRKRALSDYTCPYALAAALCGEHKAAQYSGNKEDGYKNQWITIGGAKNEDGTGEGGAKVYVGPRGHIEKGPKGMEGKHYTDPKGEGHKRGGEDKSKKAKGETHDRILAEIKAAGPSGIPAIFDRYGAEPTDLPGGLSGASHEDMARHLEQFQKPSGGEDKSKSGEEKKSANKISERDESSLKELAESQKRRSQDAKTDSSKKNRSISTATTDAFAENFRLTGDLEDSQRKAIDAGRKSIAEVYGSELEKTNPRQYNEILNKTVNRDVEYAVGFLADGPQSNKEDKSKKEEAPKVEEKKEEATTGNPTDAGSYVAPKKQQKDLVGSEKQVDWAKKIRDNTNWIVDHNAKAVIEDYKNRAPEKIADIERVLSSVKDHIGSKESASFFINARSKDGDRIDSNMIIGRNDSPFTGNDARMAIRLLAHPGIMTPFELKGELKDRAMKVAGAANKVIPISTPEGRKIYEDHRREKMGYAEANAAAYRILAAHYAEVKGEDELEWITLKGRHVQVKQGDRKGPIVEGPKDIKDEHKAPEKAPETEAQKAARFDEEKIRKDKEALAKPLKPSAFERAFMDMKNQGAAAPKIPAKAPEERRPEGRGTPSSPESNAPRGPNKAQQKAMERNAPESGDGSPRAAAKPVGGISSSVVDGGKATVFKIKGQDIRVEKGTGDSYGDMKDRAFVEYDRRSEAPEERKIREADEMHEKETSARPAPKASSHKPEDRVWDHDGEFSARAFGGKGDRSERFKTREEAIEWAKVNEKFARSRGVTDEDEQKHKDREAKADAERKAKADAEYQLRYGKRPRADANVKAGPEPTAAQAVGAAFEGEKRTPTMANGTNKDRLAALVAKMTAKKPASPEKTRKAPVVKNAERRPMSQKPQGQRAKLARLTQKMKAGYSAAESLAGNIVAAFYASLDVANYEFREADHPRDHGRFAEKAGAQGATPEAKAPEKEPVKADAPKAEPVKAPAPEKKAKKEKDVTVPIAVGGKSPHTVISGEALKDHLAGKTAYGGVKVENIKAVHKFDTATTGPAEMVYRNDGAKAKYIPTDAQEAKKAAKKFGNATKMEKVIGGFRQAYEKDLTSTDAKTRSNAIAAGLIDKLAIRMGGDAESKRTGSIGVSTLRPEHLTFGADSVKLDFPGKSGHAWSVEIEDKAIVEAVRKQAMGKQKGDNLLASSKSEINQYIGANTGGKVKDGSKKTGGATAKDFRTFHGTRAAKEMLQSVKLPDVPTEPEMVKSEAPKPTGNKKQDSLAAKTHKATEKIHAKNYKDAVKARGLAIKAREKAIKDAEAGAYEAASKFLNNTPSVAKSAYVNPSVIAEFITKARG